MYFTDRMAHFIRENYAKPEKLTIILPSERAKKFLARSLFQAYNRPLLAPEMITIDQWVKKMADRPVIDKTRLLIRLYEVYLELPQEGDLLDFSEFMSWGSQLISDFDELDRYMLNARDLFRNLSDIKEIENWSFGQEELSEGQKRFMAFWDRLPGYYHRLNEKLDSEGVYYMGKAYRFVADNILHLLDQDSERKFLFAGFNALSAAEIKLMKQLKQAGKAEVLLDADEYYLQAEKHEAGTFQRKIIRELETKEPHFVTNRLLTEPIHVRIIECAQHIGQTRVASTLLNDLSRDELNETLVLLADESLAVPFIKNIPKNVGSANITLGMPLKHSAIKTWVDLLFSIQENAHRFRTKSCYNHDLRKFWSHPFLSVILSASEKKRIVQLEYEMIRFNRIFLNVQSLSLGKLTQELLEILYTPWEQNWGQAVRQIRQLNALLFKELGEQNEFEQALIEQFDHAMMAFENLISEGFPEMSMGSFKVLFNQHWGNKNLAYHGHPTKGLQVMGLLETRLLDFKRIIVLGLNEGIMPPTNPIQTLIPMDLRKYHGLPTPRDKQGLFAHHFYRLLHHCEEMVVTYTSARENIGSNEASRYLLQIELELARMNPHVTIQKELYTIPSDEVESAVKQSIEKSVEVKARLDEFFERPLSASAINKFLTCPLDFCYRYIFEFGEDDTIEEEIESARFGTFIHDVMETLYTPFARHIKGVKVEPAPPNLTAQDVEKMLPRVEGLLHKAFMKHFDGDQSAFTTGKNLLSFQMALDLTKRLLKQEISFLSTQSQPMFIEHLELRLEGSMPILVNDKKKVLKLKGFVDRIDSVGDRIRIIDYKSGKANEAHVSMIEKNRGDLFTYFGGVKHAVQLVLYIYLYRDTFGYAPDEAGIYSLINVSEGVLKLNATSSTDELLEAFESFMGQFVEAVYDEAIPFEHEPKSSYCLYCE
jgi:ATP-dependent helicase/nuclease subunit B